MKKFFSRKSAAGLCLISLLCSLFLLPGCTETSAASMEASPALESTASSEEPSAEQTPEPTEEPTPTPEPTMNPIEQIRTDLVEFALQYEGTKYSYGGWSPDTGFDCSGLLYYTFRQFGYRISRVAADQAKNGEHVDREDLLPGDIVCFRVKGSNYVGHCGLYIGDGMFLQAMDSAHGIVVTSLDEWLETRSLEARRIIGVLPQYSAEEMAEFDLMDAEYAEELARLKEQEEAQKAAAYAIQMQETGGAVPEEAESSSSDSSDAGSSLHVIPTVEPIIDTPAPTVDPGDASASGDSQDSSSSGETQDNSSDASQESSSSAEAQDNSSGDSLQVESSSQDVSSSDSSSASQEESGSQTEASTESSADTGADSGSETPAETIPEPG